MIGKYPLISKLSKWANSICKEPLYRPWKEIRYMSQFFFVYEKFFMKEQEEENFMKPKFIFSSDDFLLYLRCYSILEKNFKNLATWTITKICMISLNFKNNLIDGLFSHNPLNFSMLPNNH